MPKINRYVDIDTVEKEAKKDYIDRHSPFIHCAKTAPSGLPFAVTIRVGHEYAHPDDPDHFIQNIRLYNGEILLGEASFLSGTLGGMGAKGNAEVTFRILPTSSKLRLTAQSYCSKHGTWESEQVEIAVQNSQTGLS